MGRHNDFHDGYLLGILLLTENHAVVPIRDSAGGLWVIEMTELARLRADNISAGENILFEVVWKIATPEDQRELQFLFGASDGELNNRGERRKLPPVDSKWLDGTWTLVQSSSSLGGYFVALCRSVQVTQDHPVLAHFRS